MSDVNLDFTVNNNSINFTVQPNDITITPSDIQLTINPSISPGAGGNIGELQYNNASLLAGIPTATYTSGNLALGNVANLKITGGTNGYVLQTDGTGNLNWTLMSGNGGGNGAPGGSNTQIQYNDNGSFGGNTGFTFNEVNGNVNIPGNLIIAGTFNGAIANANYANFAGTAYNVSGSNVSGEVNYAAIANSVAGGNVSGAVANATYANLALYATTANSVAGGNVSGQVANALVAGTVYTNAQPNITSTGVLSNLSVSGNVTANYFIGNGSNISNITTANFANFAGNVTVSSQPNITSLGNLTSLTLVSNSVVLGNGASVANSANSDIAIGNGAYAAEYTGGYHAIAIGGQSTYAGNGAIAIGDYAGKFVSNIAANARHGIAIGHAAGYGNNRGANTIALGLSSGTNQLANSIAIGQGAGNAQGVDSVAIGRWAGNNQANNSILLNASGNWLTASTANSFVVKPIRNATAANILYYDNSTGEITYQIGGANANPVAGSNTQVQFNNSNSFGASANFTFNTATNNLVIGGNISATGNIITSGVVTATGNVTGGNIRTVNGYIESQNGNIYANNGYIVGGEGVFTNLRFVSNISSNASPSPLGVSVATHKFPIVLNGTTYYILLTT